MRTTIVLVVLTSCTHTIEREQLVGRYVWNDGRIDTLEVRADGTYEYWTLKPGTKLANSGTWKYDAAANVIEFEKEKFPFINEHVSEGSWFSKPQIKNNEVHLPYNASNDAYLKQLKREGE